MSEKIMKVCDHCLDELSAEYFATGSDICEKCEDLIHTAALHYSASIRDSGKRERVEKARAEFSEPNRFTERAIKPANYCKWPWGNNDKKSKRTAGQR